MHPGRLHLPIRLSSNVHQIGVSVPLRTRLFPDLPVHENRLGYLVGFVCLWKLPNFRVQQKLLGLLGPLWMVWQQRHLQTLPGWQKCHPVQRHPVAYALLFLCDVLLVNLLENLMLTLGPRSGAGFGVPDQSLAQPYFR